MTGDDSGSFDEAPRQYIVWHASDESKDGPCDLCAERDGEIYTMDTLPCWPGDGGFGEFCDGAANCNCYLEYTDDSGDNSDIADNPFSAITSGSDGFYAQRQAEEDAHDQAAIDARNADIAAVAQESPEAAARMAARDALYGVAGTRYGPGGAYDPNGADSVTASAVARLTKSVHDTLLKTGNAEALAEWYESGADGQINWGEPGDFDACVAIAGKHIDNPEGYCNLRHQAAVGGPPGSEDKTTKSKYEHVIDDKVEKFSPDQPRDDLGRFATTTGGLTPENVAGAVASAREGGFTLDPRSGNVPTTGFQVGGHVEPLRIELTGKMSSAEIGAQIVAYVEQHQNLFKSDSSMYLGGWVQPGDSNHSEHLCIEPSKNVTDREEAVALGSTLNQVSIWDNVNFEEIYTGGNGEFIGNG